MKNFTKKIFGILFAIVTMSFIFTGCETIENHKITVTSSSFSIGTVSGFGTYKTGYEVTLTATPKTEQNKFLAWVKDGYIVSKENPYIFTANKETEGKYTAIFDSEYMNLMQLSSASVTLPGLPIDDGTMENVISNITDISFQIGTSSDTLVSLAYKQNSAPTPPLFFTNEFTILPYVINFDSDYYITYSMTIEYTDTLSGTKTTKKFPTQIKFNLNSLGSSQSNNLTVTKDETTGNYIVTRKNLTADSSWTVTEETSPTFVLTFSTLSFESTEESINNEI